MVLNGKTMFRQAESRHILATDLDMAKPVQWPDPGPGKPQTLKKFLCFFYNFEKCLDNFPTRRDPGGET